MENYSPKGLATNLAAKHGGRAPTKPHIALRVASIVITEQNLKKELMRLFDFLS